MKLEGKTVLVTGAGQGIGREIAFELARRGARVAAADLNEERVRDTAQTISREGGSAIALFCDVAQSDHCAAAVQGTVAKFGAIDALVNNASMFASIKMKPFWEIEEEDWDALMAINLRGVWQMAKAANAHLSQGASIINIASSTMMFGRPNYAHYVSSKAGVFGLGRAMARELGARDIRVNTLAPGMIVTEVPRETVNEEGRRAMISGQCLQRAGRPDDIAGVVAFLVSDDSRFMTGQLLVVDGGYAFN